MSKYVQEVPGDVRHLIFWLIMTKNCYKQFKESVDI